MKGRCPYCQEILYDNLEEHLRDVHFIDIQSYYESGNEILRSSEKCLKCGSHRTPLSTVVGANSYFLPCWRCIGEDRYEKPQAIETVQKAIRDYYSLVEGDRFLQMYLSDSIFPGETLPHGYTEFKGILKKLQGLYGIDRNKLWIPDFLPGYPRVLSVENIRGIKIVDIERVFKIKYQEDGSLTVNGITIQPASLIPHDQRHFSRYNILNINNPKTDYRNTKRVRVGDKALKLFNNRGTDTKSLFQVSESDLPSGLELVIKILILRNRSLFRLISSVVSELIKSIGTFRDSVFLRNTVIINPGSSLKVNLSWTPQEEKEGYINISIL